MRGRSAQGTKQQRQKELITHSLEGLQQEFNNWRQKRQKRGRIPEELWDGAIRAVQENPPGRVSRVLGLSYQQLKRRIQAGAAHRANRNRASKFVELNIGQLSLAGVECVVEVEEANGAKMKVQIKNANGFTPVELVRAFLEMMR